METFFVSNPLAPRALLPYWVPMLMLPLLWKSMTSKLGSSAMISLPVTVAFSHAIFLLPLALVLTARYFLVRFSDSLQEQVGWGT